MRFRISMCLLNLFVFLYVLRFISETNINADIKPFHFPHRMTDTRNLLFLDFDGVLHPTLCTSSSYFCEAGRLGSLIRDSDTDLKLVISSSWRFHHTMKKLRGFLPPELSRLVVGVTPSVTPGKHQRYREIKGFLKSYRSAPDWRALDDSAFEFPIPCPQLILCNGRIGMDDRIVSEIRGWLPPKGEK